MNQLLFEIGTEEIPAGYIQPALDHLADAAGRRLRELGLAHGAVRSMGTPRRLTLVVEDLQERQEDRRQEHLGPARDAGFDVDGNPTRAAQGFARSKGVSVDDLQVVTTAKGEYLMAIEDVEGQESRVLLPNLLEGLLRELPFPKSMRWADTTMAFVRPIQWLLAMYDGRVLEMSVEGIQSSNLTRGHRFHSPDFFAVSDFRAYEQGLAERGVMVNQEERRAMVVEEVRRAVREKAAGNGAEPVLDPGLVDTVTNLVEQPVAVCGRFDDKFLQLPDEVLITSMREHQKYFPVQGTDGKLLPLFVAVNNTRIDDVELAVSGHERVLRARLEDGLFFFTEDRKKTLGARLADLDGIIFQQQLGTMRGKSERIATLAGLIANRIAPAEKEHAVRAAELAKADLLTEMVGEFPSLQGIMGREYALHDGEPEVVARAVHEHYLPVRAGGTLPDSDVGAIVGIADRIDTLAGCFAIGERPTGNKDAFGLRRQAIGLINIIRHRGFSLNLRELIDAALSGYAATAGAAPETAAAVLEFIRLRFENDLVTAGQPQEVVEAATAVGFDNLMDCQARIAALQAFHGQDAFKVLAGSFKRIRNIIKDNQATEVDEGLLQEESEKELFSTMARVRDRSLPMIWDRDYAGALKEMLDMKEPVDRFFDDVMVMTEDAAIRQNRLNLLTGLGELVLHVGDISRMHVERE